MKDWTSGCWIHLLQLLIAHIESLCKSVETFKMISLIVKTTCAPIENCLNNVLLYNF